jgi:transposase
MAASPVRSFVGIDIATSFTASWSIADAPPSRALTLPQSPEGYATLYERLAAAGAEPASTFWVTLAVSLHAAGFLVSVVNPAHVHHFARSLPRRAKTDQLDAQLLVRFGQDRQPPLR